MTSPPTDYPANWPGARSEPAAPATPIEVLLLAVDMFIASLSDNEFGCSRSALADANQKGRQVMTSQPDEAPPTDYPDSRKSAEVRRREERVNLLEAEIWLGSLSPAQLQEVLTRARRNR